jgi:hypothetical protein
MLRLVAILIRKVSWCNMNREKIEGTLWEVIVSSDRCLHVEEEN